MKTRFHDEIYHISNRSLEVWKTRWPNSPTVTEDDSYHIDPMPTPRTWANG